MQKLSKKQSEASVDQAPAYEIHELYKGRVQVKFYPRSHQYWVSIDGGEFERRTGVTTIIGIKDKSIPLQSWQQMITFGHLLKCIDEKKDLDIELAAEAVLQCNIVKEEAADIGKEIHSWCEAYIKHKLKEPGCHNLPDIPKFPEALQGVNSFLEWEKKHKVQFVSTEKIVYSLEDDYIGIEDVIFFVDGKFCDGDFKSSNGLYNGVRLQTAAYSKARIEEGGRKSQGRWAIRLSKYSEEEYNKREEQKKELKKLLAKFTGKTYREHPIKPYRVFEAKFLDDNKNYYQRDLEAFYGFKNGFDWNKLTDPFLVGEDW